MSLSLKYGMLVFFAVLGVLQAAAANNGLRGLLFFRRSLYTYIFATIAIGVSVSFFFRWNYLFALSVIAGVQQTGLFVLSSTLAVIFTLIVASLVNIKTKCNGETQSSGLCALREGTFLQIIWSKINNKH